MKLPYHHDWKPLFDTSLGIQVKWFGRWGEDPEWEIEPSRLASDLICFFYLQKGKCTIMLNGVESVIQGGDLVVLRGADVFSFTQDPHDIQTSLSACLSLNTDASSNALLEYSFQRLYHLEAADEYERQFSLVMHVLESEGQHRVLHLAGQLFQWLAYLLDTLAPVPGKAVGSSKTVGHVLSAQAWARQRLAEELSISSWADSCGLNVDYFSRIFKSHTGMRPKNWLIEARLQQASRLLDAQERSMEEIATSCGFNCPFHFSRSFKKRFGLAPSSYRQLRMIHKDVQTQ